MNFTDYQKDAMSFRLKSADEIYALYNLAGEVGELLSAEAKLRRDGGDFLVHIENVKKELGDILWCLAAVAADWHTDLNEIAELNLQKLTSRKARNKIQGNGDNR
jgi:NTP pyrophosphatase (non-canonical NTP hydrolase)